MAFGLVTEWVETIPAGQKKRLTGLAGDWFEIADLTEGKSVHVSVNEGPFVRRKEGSILQGEPGRDELRRLDFENRNAESIDIIVTVGKGKTSQNNDAVVKNASLPVSVEATATIDAATVDGLNPPAETITPGFERLTTSKAYTGKRSLSVICISGTITVMGVALNAGEPSLSFGSSRRGNDGADALASITIDATSGTALVTYENA